MMDESLSDDSEELEELDELEELNEPEELDEAACKMAGGARSFIT